MNLIQGSFSSYSRFYYIWFQPGKRDKVLNTSTLMCEENCLILIRENRFSNIHLKRKAKTGLPWQTPLLKLKYWVVVPPSTMQYCWSLNKISIQMIKVLHFLKKELRTLWSRGLKAFLISIVTGNHSIWTYFQFSIMSEITLSLSLIYVCLTWAVCFEEKQLLVCLKQLLIKFL